MVRLCLPVVATAEEGSLVGLKLAKKVRSGNVPVSAASVWEFQGHATTPGFFFINISFVKSGT